MKLPESRVWEPILDQARGCRCHRVPWGHGRTVLTVLGILLALWLVFGFVIPALFATLKFLLIIGIIALVVVVAVTVVGKLSR
ncbi:hypothetical protein B1L11_05305 [Microbispora sp. GKU 823]|nr:hypothetical protein B1L11_05305 [Microbispora sp. GKU 823]